MNRYAGRSVISRGASNLMENSMLRQTAPFLALGLFLGLGSLSTNAAPLPVKVDTAHSRLQFMAYTKIFDAEGTFKDWMLEGSIDPEDFTTSRFKVVVQTKSLDTDNNMRDDHLRSKDFFEVEKFPTATFEVTKIIKKSATDYDLEGTFKLKSLAKPLTIPVKVEVMDMPKQGGGTEKRVRVDGKVRINRFDWGLNYKSSLLQPTIKDDVDIMFVLNAVL